MSEALRDRNKVPSLLAADKDLKETIPLRASRDGALLVALSEGDAEDLEGTAKLKEAIKLDLNVSRDKELFDKSFREITVPVIEGEFTLYIDEPEENLDNKSVYEILTDFLRIAKEQRQIIIVTHNPNLAIVGDAEQIIFVDIDKKNNLFIC